jgi:hypothetical protein
MPRMPKKKPAKKAHPKKPPAKAKATKAKKPAAKKPAAHPAKQRAANQSGAAGHPVMHAAPGTHHHVPRTEAALPGVQGHPRKPTMVAKSSGPRQL